MLKDLLQQWLLSDIFTERIKKIEDEIKSLKDDDTKNQLQQKFQSQQEIQLKQELKELRWMMGRMMDEVKKKQDPIRVEHIENVYIDRYEISNSIGAVGIKELGGKLNIGANYGQSLDEKNKTKEKDENKIKEKKKVEKDKMKEENGKIKEEKNKMTVSYQKKKIVIPIQDHSSTKPSAPQINIKRK